ncbi:MAG: FAD binding domain-containing protein [Candidatus Angelobacter sp.]
MKTPRALREALDLLAITPNVWRPLAGGTDVMVAFAAGKLPHHNFMNIWQLSELRGICVSEKEITLGALTTYSDILRHPLVCSAFPILAAAAAETGGVATQNRGTLGGNIMNASPAADTPPALLVYEAEVELTSIRGARWVPYCGFHTAYKQTLLAQDELLTRIRLPRPALGMRSQFRKVGPRKAQAISKVCFAALAGPDREDVRIAFGSVGPVPLRCYRTEASIRQGQDHAAALAGELVPITDMRSTADYRMRVAQNLLAGFLNNE